jgi:hypothetical protein
MRQCRICGKDYSYVIANPILKSAEIEVALCEEHYYDLERAKLVAYRNLIEAKYFERRGAI